MRTLLDEEFGAGNFVATIVWQKRYSRESRPAIGEVHDSIHVYAVNAEGWKGTRNRLPRLAAKEYRNPNNDPRGPWRIVPMTAPGTRANQQYEIVGPDGTVHVPPAGRCWSTIESGYRALVDQDRIRFGVTGKGAPGILRYLDEDEGLTPWTWWPHEEVGHTDESKKEIQALFGKDDAFDTPKPERLMARIIQIASDPGDLVLDFFAGSGTTAGVAHKMGRRWIAVELQKSTAEDFIVHRLSKVVGGDDPGGVTTTTERVAMDNLPDGVNPREAQEFTTLMGKFTDDESLPINVVSETAKVVRRLGKTNDGPLTPDEVKTLLSLLRKASKGADGIEVDVMPQVRSRLRAAAKTREETTTHWQGPGKIRVSSV